MDIVASFWIIQCSMAAVDNKFSFVRRVSTAELVYQGVSVVVPLSNVPALYVENQTLSRCCSPLLPVNE